MAIFRDRQLFISPGGGIRRGSGGGAAAGGQAQQPKQNTPLLAGCSCNSSYCSFFAGLGPRIAMRCISIRPSRFRMSLSFSSTVTGSTFGFSWVSMIFMCWLIIST